MPLQATSGAASYDAFGGGAAVVPNYIEDVFSTWLYTGNGNSSPLTITNNIDLSTKGGLVWVKDRTSVNDHALVDTVRGAYNTLKSDTTDASASLSTITGFNTTGFNLGGSVIANANGDSFVSWTFRKQLKFFDVVTYSGNGSNRTISHNLGSTPGCIFVKCTSQDVGGWQVYHSGMTSAAYSMNLNGTSAQSSQPTVWNSTAPTSTVFSVGSAATVNQSGDNYVAYLFASNAGGFGLTGTDNVISCGGFTANGNNTITLGYEPQWVMVRRVSSAGNDWEIYDTMRGMALTSSRVLNANTSGAEGVGGTIYPTATGFYISSYGSGDIIYIAIRRGPMKVPTDATTVFTPQIATSSGSAANTVTTNFPTDLAISQIRNGYFAEWFDRLRGDSQSTYVRLRSASTAAEATGAGGLGFDNNTGYVDNYNWQNVGGGPYVYWNMRRAPSFFDEVCYTGNDTGTRILDHNLAVFPELVIVKKRSGSLGWAVQASTFTTDNILFLNTNAALTSTASYLSYPEQNTSTQFKVRYNLNVASDTYVAYLFATCAGVSKVGSYSGTGATQTISCGFTGGARFVLIKRTDSTGDWYVWDTARGMVSGTDPSLLLNSTAAEVNANSVYTATGGFQIVSTAAGINASGGSYIFLAVA